MTYGLGTENANLPGFRRDEGHPACQVAGGPRNWGTGFMPAVYQGTRLDGGPQPIANLQTPAERRAGAAAGQARATWASSTAVICSRGSTSPSSTPGSRATSWRSACRPRPPRPSTWRARRPRRSALYGLDDPATETHRPALPAGPPAGRARRAVRPDLLRRGQQVGRAQRHRSEPRQTCRAMDQPVAGLLKDLKRRGLLDETLVVWGGEFGRTPMSEKGDGRDHNPYGFTMWMAGGGVKAGIVVGKTDEVGLHAIEDRLHVHDIHATILHALGVDHTRLIYRHQGRPERPTVNEGQVFRGLFKV